MEPAKPNNEKAPHEQRVPEIRVTAELNIPTAEIDRRRANDEKNDYREKWKLRINVTTLVVAAITMGAVIYYACVAHRQWIAMSGQLDVMRQGQRPWVGVSGPLN